MKLRSIAMITALTTAIAVGATYFPTAESAEASPHSTASSTAVLARGDFSDSQVLEFIATGHGAMATQFPDLIQYLPRSEKRLSSTERAKLTGAYQEVDPSFHKLVTIRLESGDPYSTLSALTRLQSDTKSMAQDSSSASAANGKYTGDCATLVAVALWLVVALAVVLWVPAETTNNGDVMSTREFAARMASDFRALS